MNTHELLDLAASGYCVVSNKYMRVARIDREDCKEYMARQYAPWDIQEGLNWVHSLGDRDADHYSTDSLDLSFIEKHMFPKSSNCDSPTEYLE